MNISDGSGMEKVGFGGIGYTKILKFRVRVCRLFEKSGSGGEMKFRVSDICLISRIVMA